MTDRATLWGPNTYYPPDSMDKELATQQIQEWVVEKSKVLAPGWRFAQNCNVEQCPETKRFHYQFFLHTPQVRKSAVITALSPAHIELCKNRAAVMKYCRKEDTRVATIEVPANDIPNIFQYQTIISGMWKQEDYERWLKEFNRKDPDDVAMMYLDSLVASDIQNGRKGAEYIATNPMWRNAWKKFWRSIIIRDAQNQALQSSQEADASSPSSDEAANGICPGVPDTTTIQ